MRHCHLLNLQNKKKLSKKFETIVVNLLRAFTGDQSTKDTQQVLDPDSFLSITAQDTVNPFSWYSDFSRLSSVFTEDQSANDKTCLGLFRPSLQVRLCFHNFNTTAALSRLEPYFDGLHLFLEGFTFVTSTRGIHFCNLHTRDSFL